MGDDFEMGRLISLYRHKLKADKTQWNKKVRLCPSEESKETEELDFRKN